MTPPSDELGVRAGRPAARRPRRARRALEKQAVVLGDGTDADVIAFAEDELEAAVQVFHVRGGRVRGQRGWVVDRVEDGGTGELVEQFLPQLYGGERRATTAIPREILVPALPPDAEAFERAAVERRGAAGSRSGCRSAATSRP